MQPCSAHLCAAHASAPPAQPSPAQSLSLAHKEHRPSVSLTGCLWCGERHLCCGTDKRGQKATVLEPDLDCNTWWKQFDEVPTSLTSFRHSSSETPTQAVLTQHHCPHHLPTVQRGRSKPVSVTSSMQPCVSRNKYSALFRCRSFHRRLCEPQVPDNAARASQAPTKTSHNCVPRYRSCSSSESENERRVQAPQISYKPRKQFPGTDHTESPKHRTSVVHGGIGQRSPG